MYKYVISFFFKEEKKNENENIHQFMIDKIEKYINMENIIQYNGFIYGTCIRDILADINLTIIDISLPSTEIFSFIEKMKQYGYDYNCNLSIISQTYVLSKYNTYSLRLVEQDSEMYPDYDIDVLCYDGYVITNINNDNSIIEIYNKIKNRKATVISKSYDYSLSEKNFEIILNNGN